MTLTAIVGAPSLALATQLNRAAENYHALKGEIPYSILASFNSYEQLVRAAKEYKPDLAILDENFITPQVLPLLRAFVADMLNMSNEGSTTIVFVIIDKPEQESIFAQAGIQNVILRPVNLADPNESIVFVHKLLSQREAAIANLRVERASSLYIDQRPRIGTTWRKIVGVWSPKGGVGKTTIASSLAIAIALYGNAKTLLIDSDMNVGDIHSILDLEYEKNLYGLASTFATNKRLSLADLEAFISPYKKARIPLYVLPGIVRHVLGGQPILTGKNGSEVVSALINVIRSHSDFAYVIVDIGQKISEGVHYEWLRSCDLVLIVCTSEHTTAREVYDAIDTFQRDAVFAPLLNSQHFRILFNRWDERHGLDKATFLKVVRLLEIATIPEDHSGEVTRSHNTGTSIIVTQRDHVFTQAVLNLARQIDPQMQHIGMPANGQSQPANGSKPKRKLFGVF